MDTLILYYSHTGHTKKLVEKLASEKGADVAEIKTPKPLSPIKIFFQGCPDSIRGRGWSIDIVGANPDNYSNIILAGPVWAGGFAPPVMGAAEMMPEGKSVALIAVSAGTGAKFDKIIDILKARKCEITECSDYILKGKVKKE